ncbi:winged helix DNA-binding domain-containing protein [Mucor ambiguus]|uniref:Winged helix DNA-binding domain-containing protein n=1 Tax=Mucor ambiguus TaxID=91626 RepID=A0A0C9LZG1_9FUNG|nr:winged helix DNA-binding domain-containing protein [Mucor ambiguus]
MEQAFNSSGNNTMRSFMLSNTGGATGAAAGYSQATPPPSNTTDQTAYSSTASQPIQLPQKSSQANTFVHKLYNMVLDDQFQHLIAWNYTGASFIVCNIMEFARDVLPKHFKHNNFSSFVRQLNMYGFHKVNKSPRGHRTLAENQIWEFSHSKFLRDRPDLLDDIKRKTMETDTVRRETDFHAHMAMMQVSQSDMLQQINHLYDSFSQIVKELHETKQKQEYHNKMVKNVLSYITRQNGGQLPHELGSEFKKLDMNKSAPSIFVTTHQDHFSHHHTQQQPLVPTQNRPNNSLSPSITFSSTLPPSPNPTNLASSSSTTTASSTSLDIKHGYYQPNTSQSPSQVLAAAQAVAASVAVTLPDIMNSPTPTHQTSNNRNPHHFSFNNSPHHTMNG